VRSQPFVTTSEWMFVNTLSAYFPKIVGSATVASLLQTSKSMFDVLRRPQLYSIFGDVSQTSSQYMLSAPLCRPGAPFGTST
jgi:hypothetical protein